MLKLSEYEIDFRPQRAIQAQALADFMVENTLLTAIEPSTSVQTPDPNRTWVLYLDCSVRQQHQRAGFVLQSSDKQDFACALKYEFTANNNGSEYEALISDLHMALAMNMEKLII